jgi:hypothetical protein
LVFLFFLFGAQRLFFFYEWQGWSSDFDISPQDKDTEMKQRTKGDSCLQGVGDDRHTFEALCKER